MAGGIGYLAGNGYADEGNVIRHGESLRDMIVDYSKNTRVLGMIGMCDTEANRSDVLDGSAPLGYIILYQDGRFFKSKVIYGDPDVNVYGLDLEYMNNRQAIRVEMFGYTALSLITLLEA